MEVAVTTLDISAPYCSHYQSSSYLKKPFCRTSFELRNAKWRRCRRRVCIGRMKTKGCQHIDVLVDEGNEAMMPFTKS
jgi:hypothetical protein